MRELAGKTAFITGGASGMGLGMAHAFGGAGMRIMLADLREDRLADAVAALTAKGVEVDALAFDVSDRAAMARAAERTVERFGSTHLVVANAGVGIIGRVRDASYDDWDWSNGVNMGGVINAIQAFLPILRKQGEGHFVANASMAGLTPVAHGGVYSVQKAAVVAMVEALYTELAEDGVQASVVCPGMVRTNIGETLKLRPDSFADHGIQVKLPLGPPPGAAPSPMDLAMDPMEVGERVLKGVLADDLYILTHREFGDEIREHFVPILEAMPSDRLPGPPPGSAPGGPPPGAPKGGVAFSAYPRVLAAKRAIPR